MQFKQKIIQESLTESVSKLSCGYEPHKKIVNAFIAVPKVA